jgi:hypothetical protein
MEKKRVQPATKSVKVCNVTNVNSITDNKDLLMVSLAKFYSTKGNITSILPIIEGKSEMSLRLIDWFVTNYSKKYSTIITRSTADNNVVHFNVYLSYRSQLKAYSKQQFDPFKRRERIKFFYEREKSVESTVGQLNFFRWILQNYIIDYIEDHAIEVENDMIAAQKDNQRKKQDLEIQEKQIKDIDQTIKRKKRNELSKSFVKNMNTYQGTRKISFD